MPDQLANAVLVIHSAATWFMVGLIWFVQIVHYPLMGHVPQPHATTYSARHQRLTTRVVAPAMLIELAATAGLFFCPSPSTPFSAARIAGAALLAVAWLSTFLIQVPLHRSLLMSHDPRALRRLVASNVIRTLAWTGRGAVAAGLLWLSFPTPR